MSGLFNRNTTTTGQVTVVNNADEQDASAKGDFSAAIESIGTAIGELKDALPEMLEKAFTGAIVSDAANDAMYDALASATHDSISDLHDEGVFGVSPRNNPAAEDDDGRGFTQAQLLAVETLDTNEHLVNSLEMALDKSFDKHNVGKNENQQHENDRKSIDAGMNSEKNAAKNVNAKISDDVHGIHEIMNERKPEHDIDRAVGLPDNNIPKQKGKQAINSFDSNGNNDATAPELRTDFFDFNKLLAGFDDDEDAELKPKKKKDETGTERSRDKMKDDLQLKFLSKTAPDFMSKGNQVFDKILNDELNVHSDQTNSDSGSIAKKMGGLGSLVKGGGIAALGAATIASLGMIGMAGKSLWDWHKASSEANANIDKNLKNATDANNKMKNGANDDLRDANIKSDKADAELAKEKNGILASVADAVFGAKTEGVRKKEYDAAMAEADRKVELARYNRMLDRAEAYGVKRNDSKAVGKWLEEQKQLASKAGVNVEDKGAFIKFQIAELERYKAAQKKALDNGTQPNDQKPANQQQNPQQPAVQKNAQPNIQQETAVPLAVGSNTNTTPNVINAGTGVMTDDIITAEEKARQFKQFTFEGIRDAFLLPEVQAVLTTTAKAAGTSVEHKLMG